MRRPPSVPSWVILLLVCGGLWGVFRLTDADSLPHIVSWWAIDLVAISAVVWRGWTSPAQRCTWWLLAGGFALYAVGDITWDLWDISAVTTQRLIVDGIYQVSYVVIGVALWRLTGSDRDDRWEDRFDSLLVWLSVASAGYVFLWLPLQTQALPEWGAISAAATLLTISFTATAVVRLLVSPVTARTRALLATGSAVGVVLLADVIYTWESIQAGWGTVDADTAGWDDLYLLGWTAVAISAVLPSVGRLTATHELGGPGRVSLRPWMSVVLALVAFTLTVSSGAVVAASVVVAALALRLVWSYAAATHRVGRQQRVHEVSTQLGAAGDHFDHLINGWLDLLNGAGNAHVLEPGQSACAGAIDVVDVTHDPRYGDRRLCVHQWDSRDNQADVVGLAGMLGLAYERERARRSLLDAQGRAQLSSWLAHTSDALVAIQGERIVYSSPALQRMIPTPDDAKADWPLGQRMTDLDAALTEDGVRELSTGAVVSVSVSVLPDDDVAVWTVHDITDQQRMAQQLHAMAYTDSLTGISNRAAFVDRLDSPDDNQWLALIDVDDFKHINDTFGHPAGDAVLTALATRLASHPAVVEAFRMGGDEFAALLDGEHLDLFEDLVPTLAQPVDAIDVSVSIGVAPCGPHALADADRVLYDAKRSGKNQLIRAEG